MLLAITDAEAAVPKALAGAERWEAHRKAFHQLRGPVCQGELLHREGTKLLFTSDTPILRNENGAYRQVTDALPLLGLMAAAENNFCGLELSWDGDGWRLVAHSDRMARPRMYYTVFRGGVAFSNDLRELLPLSSGRMHPAAVFSVLKYGDVPEHLTVAEGVRTVPVGEYVSLTEAQWARLLREGMFRPEDDFKPFFRLPFPMDGGDIRETERLLTDQLAFIATLSPVVPVSGGVDSALLNHLVDRHTDSPFPAYFIQFGDGDPELPFAQEAVKGTKAELYVGKFTATDFIPCFEAQNERIIHPIGEGSAIAAAYYYRNDLSAGRHVIDGTMADGCYGSTNYLRPLIGSLPSRPLWQQRINERIAALLQWHRLPGQDRFHPRDSLMPDPYLRFMDVYLGPFANTLLRDAEAHCRELLPMWQRLYSYVDRPGHELDEWMRYTVFKMVAYASKVTTAKLHDNARPLSSGIYPFMWKSVLTDQGHYHWREKTQDGIIKYPLKKILERYMPKEFIYRKKVGMNACFEDWVHHPANRAYLSGLLLTEGGVPEYFLGSRLRPLVRNYQRNMLHPNLARLVLNLATMEAWCQRNGLRP